MLLYNNRLICLLPFARKPDPRRVSKQVSRELPQAWLFGLVRFRAAGRTKSAAGKPIQRAAGRKIYAICCDLPALLARFSLSLLSQSSASGRSLFTKADRRERAQASVQKLCAVFSFFPRSRP